MKRFGITYATKYMLSVWNDWGYFTCRAANEQQAISLLLDAAYAPGVIICIANAVEWKKEFHGQQILSVASPD